MSPERQEKFFSGWVWLLIVFLLIVLAVAVSYFDNESGLTAPPPTNNGTNNAIAREPRDYTVFYRAGVFGPTNIRIHVGDKVIFQNFDQTALRIVSEGYPNEPELEDFDSKTDILLNGQFLFVFPKPGIFGYYNFNNPDEAGTVIVRP